VSSRILAQVRERVAPQLVGEVAGRLFEQLEAPAGPDHLVGAEAEEEVAHLLGEQHVGVVDGDPDRAGLGQGPGLHGRAGARRRVWGVGAHQAGNLVTVASPSSAMPKGGLRVALLRVADLGQGLDLVVAVYVDQAGRGELGEAPLRGVGRNPVPVRRAVGGENESGLEALADEQERLGGQAQLRCQLSVQ
jgi:hypothetical protein